jgi:hypothetical protein
LCRFTFVKRLLPFVYAVFSDTPVSESDAKIRLLFYSAIFFFAPIPRQFYVFAFQHLMSDVYRRKKTYIFLFLRFSMNSS